MALCNHTRVIWSCRHCRSAYARTREHVRGNTPVYRELATKPWRPLTRA